MIPDASQTYELVVGALRDAIAHPEFGSRLLLGGKTSALSGARREVWLSAAIASAFKAAGYHVQPEYCLPDGGRIDITVMDGDDVSCAIEVKFFYAHQCRRGKGHPFICNTAWDFYKRRAPASGASRL